MSWSSGASSAPGFRGAAGRRRGTEGRSPVPYREDPMAYEPTRMCRCNPPRKAPRWISWSRQNPGRRYFACVNAMHGGCGYVEWYDDPLPSFLSLLVGDMRDAIYRLRAAENVPALANVTALVDEQVGSEAMVHAMEAQLRERNAEIVALKGKYDSVVLLCFMFVLGLVSGKVFFQ